MRWLTRAWRRVVRAARVRARLVERLRVWRAENARLRRAVAEVLTVADREQTRMRLAHAEALSAAQQEIRDLRLEAQHADSLRTDALRTADRKTEWGVTLYRRIRAIDELADEMPPAWAVRVRAHTRLETQETNR